MLKSLNLDLNEDTFLKEHKLSILVKSTKPTSPLPFQTPIHTHPLYVSLSPSLSLLVVSIGGFFSILCSFQYSGIYYSYFSCFPFFSSDVIVIKKNVQMRINLTFQWVVAYFIGGLS